MRAAALSFLLLSSAVPAAAYRPITPPAPEFPAADAWINAKPLTMARMKGRRVVLVAFINTANVNSLRALKTLTIWHEAFRLQGLMVVGVHTPIYPFQRDPAYVRAEVRRQGIDFPVVVDNDRQIWNAYANTGWPTFYLIDKKGRIVWDLAGEARYEEFEGELRTALSDLGYRVPKAEPLAKDPPTTDCGAATPVRTAAAGRLRDADDSSLASAIMTAAREGELTKRGEWNVEAESLKLAQKNGDLSAALRVIYRGAQSFAVLAGAEGRKTRFYLRQDDLWLHAGNAGADVLFDDDGQSYVEVEAPRLYRLTQNPNDNVHALWVVPNKPGAAVFSFSFADKCLPYAP